MYKPKFAEAFNEHFNQLPDDVKETTIQRLKDINDIPEDADVSGSISELIIQDMLMNVIDDVFRADHALSDLVDNGIPHTFVEKHNMTEEQATAFHNGVRLAYNLFEGMIIRSDVISTFMSALREVADAED